MPDKLRELYDAWMKTAGEDPSLYQAFQAGLTAGAVSMRMRAMDCVKGKDMNAIKNAIGQLSDIPQA